MTSMTRDGDPYGSLKNGRLETGIVDRGTSMKGSAYLEQAEQSVVPKSEDGSFDGTVFEEWGNVSL
ncbi:hypothetical protein GB937_008880 [Aspergillus fischeri]|nr:hypothetical protein GB937_008880 [Aspergillus fischeri]